MRYTHVAWWQPQPTPQGGLGRLICICNFVSVLMPEREGEMYVEMHENGLAGLPGTRMEAAQ